MQSQPTRLPRRNGAAPSVRDLVAQSDFARLDPRRARELLDRTADPLTEDRGRDGS